MAREISETETQLSACTEVKPLHELSQIEVAKLNAKNNSKGNNTELHIEVEENKDMCEKDRLLLDIYGPQNEEPIVHQAPAENRQFYRDTFVYFNFNRNEDYDVPEEFSEPPKRNKFVRIVFMILGVMLAVTAVGVWLINEFLDEIFKEFNTAICIGAAVMMVALSYIWACVPSATHGIVSYILLVLQVIFTILLCGGVTVRYHTEAILIALGSLVVIVLLCLALACTSFDFTSWILYVVAAMIAVSVASLVLMGAKLIFKVNIPILTLVITGIGLLVQTIMFVIELQAIFGGKAVELDIDDYAIGAYMLYTSIINMFLQLLRITGIAENL